MDWYERARTVGQIVGEHLVRARERHRQTQPEAAEFLHSRGLRWTRDNIAALESARRATIDLEELLALSWAYGVPLSAWFSGDGDVLVTTGLTLERERLREALEGGRVIPDVHGEQVERITAAMRGQEASRRAVEADAHAARKLGTAVEAVTEAARRVWGRTLTEERDARLGELSDLPTRSVRARRGRMTIRLMREIEAELPRGESQ